MCTDMYVCTGMYVCACMCVSVCRRPYVCYASNWVRLKVLNKLRGARLFFPTALVATHNINIIVPVCTSLPHCRMYT